MQVYRFTIIAEGSSINGYGHISRSSALAKYINNSGHKANLIINSDLDTVQEKNRGNIFNPDIFILDLPTSNAELLRQVQASTAKVVGLDWVGSQKLDLTINIQSQINARKGNEHKEGLEFCIIRKEISDLTTTCTTEGVIVSIGGADVLNLSERMAMQLVENHQVVSIIKGPFNQNIINTKRYKVYFNPNNLPSLMASCEWAIANCGTTLFELMSLGKAVWVIPQTLAEENLAKTLLNKQGILGIGEKIRIPSNSLIRTIGCNAASIIDQKGLSRIIHESILLLKK